MFNFFLLFPGKFRNDFLVKRSFPDRSEITEQGSGNFRFTEQKSRSRIDRNSGIPEPL